MIAMFLRDKFRRLVPGATISWLKDQVGAPDMLHLLQQLKLKGFKPTVAVDIGAFEGQWSLQARKVFPDLKLLLIEPLPEKRAEIEELARSIGAESRFRLLSDKAGEVVSFYVGSCGSSIHEPKRFESQYSLEIETTTLDELLASSHFEAPNIIKIDVQGAEDRVLRGGENVLKNAEVLIIELSIVNSYSQGLLVHDMINFLAQRNLYLYDVAGLLRANRTRSVNEFDGVFVRKDSPLWDLRHFLPEEAPEP